jgi:hypothetical protein
MLELLHKGMEMLTQSNYTWWIFVSVSMIVLGIMQWHGKLPSSRAVQDIAATVNSKGGNILVLTFLSLVFFFTGMRFLYFCIMMIIEGKLTPDNAVAVTGINWVTGAAFGMAFSSLLKAMTGEGTRSRSTDIPPDQQGKGSITVTAPIESLTPGTVTLKQTEQKLPESNA